MAAAVPVDTDLATPAAAPDDVVASAPLDWQGISGRRWVWVVAGAGVFAAVQALLVPIQAAFWPAWIPRTSGYIAPGVAGYAAALVIAVVMAVSAPRWWWLPVLCLAAGPALAGQPVAPLSWLWTYPNSQEWVAGRWVAIGFDWAAVAVPAWLVARRTRPQPPAWDRWDKAATGTAAVAILVVVVCSYGLSLGAGVSDGATDHLPAAFAVLVVAMAARPAGRLLLALTALFTVDPLLIDSIWGDLRFRKWNQVPEELARSSWPVRLVLIAFAAGSLWPLATRLWRRGGVVVWLVALNVANLADAALTLTAVGSGRAVEVNPVVAWAGFPAKLVVAALASVGLAKWRPLWLRWLTLVLCSVLAWHLAGLLAGGPET